MRAALLCALALLAAGASNAASPPASGAAADNKPKASSFAPHGGPHSRVYGAPIQQRILKNRPKPQLKASPLPETPAA